MLFATLTLAAVAAFLGKALAFIVMIAVIAFVHELGHYVIAKLCGVKVYEFALGFGQKVWSRKWGETEYSLRWIPLGAFVRPAGMNPDEDEAEVENLEELKGRSFAEKNFFAKQAILAAGAGGNMVFAAAVFAGVLFVSGIQNSNIEIKEAMADRPAAQAGLRGGDIISALDGTPVVDHQHGINYIYSHPDTPLKIEVLRFEDRPPITLAGPDPGLVGELAVSATGVRLEVLSVDPGKAADKAGLQAGMVITAIGGKQVSDLGTAKDGLDLMRQGPKPLTVLAPKRLTFTVVPARQPDGRGLIGITSLPHSFGARIAVGFNEAVTRGIKRTAEGVFMIYRQALTLLWTSLGKMEVPKEVGGPLKIASEIGRGVDLGLIYLLQLTAFLSLAIGVFNLLPIPALDGGRMFVLAVKTALELGHRLVQPRADSHEVLGPRGEEVLHFMGFVFLVFLLVVVSWKDVREMTSGDSPATKPGAPAAITPTTAPAKAK
ncbi:MAG: RIP metalloprotease RseP [Candidatus Wallbacteria bacterium]|nr:RIP metalloprotease RseP [Candidatus Wallbacteria bacterium]